MAEDGFGYQAAIAFVMSRLPSKSNPHAVDREQILASALSLLPEASTEESVHYRRRVTKFVRISPAGEGFGRQRGYWQIVSEALPPERRRESYLNQFPDELTPQQYSLLFRYLLSHAKIFGLENEAKIRLALSRFKIREARGWKERDCMPYFA